MTVFALAFRAWVLTIVLHVCLADSTTDEEAEQPKILILGAGMSGITVAKTLEDAGHHNFVMIEGSSRIGGRMKSARLSGTTVELGAMWIYGAGSNPIYNLLRENQISMNEDYPDSWTVRDSNGTDVTDEADDAQERLDEAIEAFDADAVEAVEKGLPDFTVKAGLRSNGWSAKTPVEEVIEGFNCDFEFAVSSGHLSGKHAYWWAPYEAFDSEDVPIMDDPRGIESLASILGQNFTQDADRMKFNEVVTDIKQNETGVVVETSSGSSYHGDYVVVTFSLGVLQSGNVKFDPELPACKRLAINKFGMGYLTQLYIKFPFTFWDDTMNILYASEDRGKYSVYVNTNHLHPQSHILQVSIWDDESRRVERLDEASVVNDIISHLQRMYPNIAVPAAVTHTMSRWTYDPLTYGAYSYWPTAFTEANMADMMARFGRVHFAGEHLDPVQYSYVHAAYASGVRTGSTLARCIRYGRRCPRSTYFRCRRKGYDDECVSRTGSIGRLATFMTVLTSCIAKFYLF